MGEPLRLAELFHRLYDAFNSRDLETALAAMHPDVVWANGLEGGHVEGREEVRAYWTRQWSTMDTRAQPTGLTIGEDGSVCVQVHLVGRDLGGNLLFDSEATHLFRIEDGRIRRFDILP